MKCPHCTTAIHEAWTDNTILNFHGGTLWRVRLTTCPECYKDILQLGLANRGAGNLYPPSTWTLIHPEGSNRGPLSTDVPAPIAADYNEAAIVLPLSPKASAALSRRCLQAVLRQAGYNERDLAKQIDAALAETDGRKALPTGVHSTLDAIRNFGSFSAHPITDVTTLQVIDVEDHEAEYCLDVLDALFDHYYVRPAEAKRRRALLDAKLSAAGKPPSK
jgi:uncharacterized protein DUF4145